MMPLFGGVFIVALASIGVLKIVTPGLAAVAAKRVCLSFAVLLLARTFIGRFDGGILRTLTDIVGILASIGAVIYIFDPTRGAAAWKKLATLVVGFFLLRVSLAMLWESMLGKAVLLTAVSVMLIAMLRGATK